MRNPLLRLLIALNLPWLAAAQAPIKIAFNIYTDTSEKFTSSSEYLITQAADKIIDWVYVNQDYPPYRAFELAILRRGNTLSCVNITEPNALPLFTITIKQNSFAYTDIWYDREGNFIEFITHTVRIAPETGTLWEDERVKATLKMGIYEEYKKKPDFSYNDPPYYYYINNNTIEKRFWERVNQRHFIQLKDGIYHDAITSEIYADDRWEDNGWATMANWQTLRAEDPLVNAINWYILEAIVRPAIYMPALLGLATGTFEIEE